MSVSIKVSDLPPAEVSAPVLSPGDPLGFYGVDKEDVLVPDAAPSILTLPDVEPIIPFNTTPVAWLKNPVNRTDLPAELRNSFPDDAFVTNRNMLMKLLDIFLFAGTAKSFEIRMTRTQDQIFFLENPPFPPPATGPAGVGTPKKYGIAFEEKLTTTTNLAQEYYYVFQSYTLLHSATVVVRCEVDCVNEDGQLSEIKSHVYVAEPKPEDEAIYYQQVWRQMMFGRVKEAIIGTYTTKKYKGPATFFRIERPSFETITALAGMDDGRDMPFLVALAALLQWIRANIADGNTKVFAFDFATATVSLTPV